MNYAVCEISGRQYVIYPGKMFEVDKLSLDGKNTYSSEKVLMTVDGEKVEVGAPYLKTKLDFEVLGIKKTKIRVAKFHAKANYRRVNGSVREVTQLKLLEDRKQNTEEKTIKAKPKTTKKEKE